MKTTNSLHIIDSMDATKPLVIQGEQTSLRTDDNNVDIDMELATLAENNLYFNSLAHFLSSQLSLLRQSISEGRG
jgi:flagellar basal-body rod protein FlgB